MSWKGTQAEQTHQFQALSNDSRNASARELGDLDVVISKARHGSRERLDQGGFGCFVVRVFLDLSTNERRGDGSAPVIPCSKTSCCCPLMLPLFVQVHSNRKLERTHLHAKCTTKCQRQNWQNRDPTIPSEWKKHAWIMESQATLRDFTLMCPFPPHTHNQHQLIIRHGGRRVDNQMQNVGGMGTSQRQR